MDRINENSILLFNSEVILFVKIDYFQDYIPELVVGFIGIHRVSANRICKQNTAVTCGYKTLVVKEISKAGNHSSSAASKVLTHIIRIH